MDQALLSSKIVVIEEPPNIQVVNPAPTSITGVVGVCERGPVGVATLVTSFEQYLQVFGGYTANADVALAADGFFAGGGQFLWVVRTVHYTDVTNPNSKTSASASGTLYTAALAQTSGTVRAAHAGPYALVAGQTLVITVDSHSPVTATFSATAGYQQSTTGPYALSNGQTLTVAIDGGWFRRSTSRRRTSSASARRRRSKWRRPSTGRSWARAPPLSRTRSRSRATRRGSAPRST